MALTNAQRQRRYRERRKAQQPRLHYRRPQDRSSGRMRYAPCSTFRMSTKRGSTTFPTISGSCGFRKFCRLISGNSGRLVDGIVSVLGGKIKVPGAI